MADHGFDLDAIERKRDGHSIFAPSASAMWMNCSGSLIPNILAPDDAGFDAAYGTVGHACGEEWLKTGERPGYRVGTIETVVNHGVPFKIEIDDEMLAFVEEYVDWCAYLPGDHYVEVRVDFSRITPIPKQGGTADHCACSPGLMIITDLKMGKGYQVYAKDNTQALLYAYGFFLMYDWLYNFKKIVIRIAQPRLDHFDVWEVTRDELIEFAGYAKARAALAWRKNAERTPGEKQCKFCKVAGSCTAYAMWQATLNEDAFEDLTVTNDEMAEFKAELDELETFDQPFELPQADPAMLTTENLSRIAPYRKHAENWWKRVEDELERRMLNGEKAPMHKMVLGKTNRVIPDQRRALEYLTFDLNLRRGDLITEKMVGVTEIESLLMKAGHRRRELPDLLQPIVFKPMGKPVMAHISDKRPELATADDDAFDDISDGEDL